LSSSSLAYARAGADRLSSPVDDVEPSSMRIVSLLPSTT